MIIAFLYGEKGEKKGYGFIQGGEYAVQYGCERYMNFYCGEQGRSIRFTAVGNDRFMLLYVIALPKGNYHESRGQIIASGYLFGAKEADELMSHPEYILELKHCICSEDFMEEGKINSWEQVRMHNGQNRLDREKTEILLPGELQKPYFTAVLSNRSKIDTQVFHSMIDYSEGDAVQYLIKALNLFPLKIRKYISWNTNIRKLTEGEDYEWNFLPQRILEQIEASGFAGGRVVKRIILCDGNIIRFQCQRLIDNAWTKYISEFNKIGPKDELWTESRERFTTRLIETKHKEKGNMEKNNKIKRQYRTYRDMRNEKIKSGISAIVRAVFLIILTVWTARAIQINEIEEQIYTLNIHLDVFCAMGFFGIAYIFSSFLSDIKWKRKIRRIYQKSARK